MPLIVGFVELLGGVLLLTAGIAGASFSDVIKGRAGQLYKQHQTAGAAGATSAAAVSTNTAGQVNPVPGATGSRLDAGFDVTSKTFVAPYSGTVVTATASDPGWKGGGYVAIVSADLKRVTYFAEGLLPIVGAGQKVAAGEVIATPVANPYNGIVGNIELGPASPNGQPLAHTVSNPAAVVTEFYNWLRSLGGPAATSTSSAGFA